MKIASYPHAIALAALAAKEIASELEAPAAPIHGPILSLVATLFAVELDRVERDFDAALRVPPAKLEAALDISDRSRDEALLALFRPPTRQHPMSVYEHFVTKVHSADEGDRSDG